MHFVGYCGVNFLFEPLVRGVRYRKHNRETNKLQPSLCRTLVIAEVSLPRHLVKLRRRMTPKPVTGNMRGGFWEEPVGIPRRANRFLCLPRITL
jgi:hypothetical protein